MEQKRAPATTSVAQRRQSVTDLHKHFHLSKSVFSLLFSVEKFSLFPPASHASQHRGLVAAGFGRRNALTLPIIYTADGWKCFIRAIALFCCSVWRMRRRENFTHFVIPVVLCFWAAQETESLF